MKLRIMRNLLIYNFCTGLLLMTLSFCASAKEINAKALLKKGNDAYAKNQFEEAGEAYRKVLNAGYESAAAYFNMGNVYYKISEYPSAILFYEKALKMSPGDADIQMNLQLANLKITDRIETVPEFFLTKWWKGFIYFFSIETLSIFTIIAFLGGFLLMIVYLFLVTSGPKKVAFYTGFIALSVGMMLLLITVVQSSYLNSYKQGIVFAGSVDVKSGPDSKQKTLFVIHDGTKVTIKDSDADWVNVTLSNGNGGWIKYSDIKLI